MKTNKNKTRETSDKTAARSDKRSGTGKRVRSSRKPNAEQAKKPGTVERGRPTVERKRQGTRH